MNGTSRDGSDITRLRKQQVLLAEQQHSKQNPRTRPPVNKGGGFNDTVVSTLNIKGLTQDIRSVLNREPVERSERLSYRSVINIDINFDNYTNIKNPTGIILDNVGNMYIADTGNRKVIKFNNITGEDTEIGSGFISPQGLALDTNGNLYISDFSNRTVSKYNSNGVFVKNLVITPTTPWGLPRNIAVDSTNNVYVTDSDKSLVFKFDSNGNIQGPVGTGFGEPVGIAINSNNTIYISDTGTYKIVAITSSGVQTDFITGISGGEWLAVDSNDNLYMKDSASNAVSKYLTNGTFVATFDLGFNNPHGVAFDSTGNIYVVDSGNNRIVKSNIDVSTLTLNFSGQLEFSNPQSIAIDSYRNIYVADCYNNRIAKINTTTYTVTSLSAVFNSPHGVTIDLKNNIYVADTGNNVIAKYDSSGVFVRNLGPTFDMPLGVFVNGTILYVADCSGSITKLNTTSGDVLGTIGSGLNCPQGITVSANGSLVYVADTGNGKVVKITSQGTTIFASGFAHPYGIALDLAGNVFVADEMSNGTVLISKYTSSGILIGKVGGLGGMPGILADTDNNIYYINPNNNRLNKIATSNIWDYVGRELYIDYSQYTYPNIRDGRDVVIDSDRNIYVNDCFHDIIAKITPDGIIRSFYDGGMPGAQNKDGLIVDSDGNVYIGKSTSNGGLFKNTPAGERIELSLDFSQYFIGFGEPRTTFNNPHACWRDPLGNIYVADAANNTAAKVSPTGVVTNLVTNWGSRRQRLLGMREYFQYVYSIVLDRNRNAYVADQQGSIGGIAKITPDGVLRPFIINYSDYCRPYYTQMAYITIDSSDNVYNLDLSLWSAPENYLDVDGRNFLTKVTPQGVASKLQIDCSQYTFTNQYNIIYPTQPTIDSSNNIYAYDQSNEKIVKLSTSTYNITTSISRFDNYISNGFLSPNGVVADSVGNLYVTDRSFAKIVKIAPTGTVTKLDSNFSGYYNNPDDYFPGFTFTGGIAIDSIGNLYVGDQAERRIAKITPEGIVSRLLNETYEENGINISEMYQIATDSDNNIYFTGVLSLSWGFISRGVTRINPTAGIYAISTLGTDMSRYITNSLHGAWGVAVDSAKNVYFTDIRYNKIGKITPAGVVTILSTDFSNYGSIGFDAPHGIAVDSAGNVYVADTNNNKVAKITPRGIVTSLGNNFNKPETLTIDSFGNLYVVDTGNRRIRKIIY